uniref:Uncharacterized protein n=1 Tax=Sphaerodactylus townsendi TaxID=933632 RepID=A0ACB8G5G9_9SAUR
MFNLGYMHEKGLGIKQDIQSLQNASMTWLLMLVPMLKFQSSLPLCKLGIAMPSSIYKKPISREVFSHLDMDQLFGTRVGPLPHDLIIALLLGTVIAYRQRQHQATPQACRTPTSRTSPRALLQNILHINSKKAEDLDVVNWIFSQLGLLL